MKIIVKFGMKYKETFNNKKDAIFFINNMGDVWFKDKAIGEVKGDRKIITMVLREENTTIPFYLRKDN